MRPATRMPTIPHPPTRVEVLHGCAIEELDLEPDGSVQMCVTSPPYFGLRSYLPEDHPMKAYEIGTEKTPQEYVAKLVEVFRAVRRVLADDGLADRLLAQGGLVDKFTAKDGPLEQLATVTDSLNRLAPGMEALTPTVEALRDAVLAMTRVVDPLSNIAERIPLPGRRLWPFRDDE